MFSIPEKLAETEDVSLSRVFGVKEQCFGSSPDLTWPGIIFPWS